MRGHGFRIDLLKSNSIQAGQIDAFRDTFGAPFERTKLSPIISRKKKETQLLKKGIFGRFVGQCKMAAPARNRESAAAINGALRAMQPTIKT